MSQKSEMGTTVFKIPTINESAIYPPEQVFAKCGFSYLLTKGGHLASSEAEYKKLMNCLKRLGEQDFFILENIKQTITDGKTPFYAKLPVTSSFSDFNNVVNQFDPIFGHLPYHFFIYGKNDSWGIYICEYPTINIIGCKKRIAEDFSKVFNIKGNGFDTLKDFIGREYENHPDWLQSLINNYHL